MFDYFISVTTLEIHFNNGIVQSIYLIRKKLSLYFRANGLLKKQENYLIGCENSFS